MSNDLNIRIKINSDTKALEITQNGITKVSDSAIKASGGIDHLSSSVNNSVNSVKNLALSYFGLNALLSSSRMIIETADSFNRLDGRLSLATDSVKEFHVQQKELLSLAKETHTPLQNITDLYIKLDPALERLGATTETTNKVTENFAKGLKLGGANAVESSAAILQFAQAMGSGVLRGDEFNSMAEASPKLMEYMAKGLGVPQGELRKMAEAGELTAGRVSAALLKMSDDIDHDFKLIPKTVGDSIVDFKTDMGVMISEVDKATGVTNSLSSSITGFSSMLSGSAGDIISTINTVQEYSSVIEGLAVTYGVMAVASKSAVAVELWYASAKEKTTIATQLNTAASITNMGVTKNVTAAQIAGAEASVLMGTALKAIPFIAVASTVFMLASSFFESKKQSDDLNNSLNATAESLSKLTRAQLENKRQNLSLELQSSGLELRQLKQKYGAKSGRTVEQQAEIDDLEAYIKSLNNAGKNIAVAQTKIRNVSTTIKTTSTPTKAPPSLEEQIAVLEANGSALNDKKNKAEERAAEKKRKEAERLAQKEYDQEVKRLDLQQSATLDYYKTIGDASSVYVIEESDKLQKLASAGILSNEQMIDVWLKDNEEFAWKNSELERETDKKILEKHIKTIEDKRSALLDYYTQIGDISSAFEISEANKLQKLAESGVYTNEQMLAIWSKDNETYQKEQFEKNNKFWFNLFDGIEKGMDNQIFDAMTNKWTSWGDWFKDFWSSLSTSVARSLSSMLSTSITGSLKEMLLGSVDSGGAQNIFKTYGGFGGALGFSAPAALAGSNTDAAGFTTTTGGTVFDAAGQITKSGSDAESVLSALSNTSSIKTAYGLFTNGIEATVAPYIEQFGSFMQASQFNVGGTSLSGGGALLGGIGGYAIGSLGDKLFGADTKAGSYGAIGGAIGGMFGPVGFAIGAGLGSIIGGMFGSKKSDGVTIFGTATSDYADGTFDSKKKSWFKTKEYHDAFDAKSREQIQSTIGAYDYLLIQMGEIDKILAISGGKFASIQDFLDRGVAQTFIDTITTADTTEMYNAWSDYAQSINTTIQSALSDSINTYIGDTRNFQTWTLERSGNSLEALKLKSEWATADTDNLQKMLGLDGVTVDNYLIKYKEAINNSFDPQTLQNYKTLGEQLMNNAEAADAYTNALKEQAAVSAKMRPSDMMLSRVSDTTSVTGQSDGTVTKELLNAFNQLIRAIDKQNTLTQLAAGRV